MKLYTDGSCLNNQHDPSKRRMRIVVADETGTVLVEKAMKGGSNNIAELWAVTEAMLFAKNGGIEKIELYTDSRNNLAWLDGRIGKNLNDRSAVISLLHTITSLRRHVNLTVTWMPREKNVAGVYIEENVLAAVDADAAAETAPGAK